MHILRQILAYSCGLPTDLYLTRHGESYRNKGLALTTTRLFFDTLEQFQQYGSHPDHLIPLTPDGHKQAKETAIRFVKAVGEKRVVAPKAIVHSGYNRAIDTAEKIMEQWLIATRQQIPLIEDFSFREREPGITHVLLTHEVDDFMKWRDRYWGCFGQIHSQPLGGESLIQLREGRIRHGLLNKYRQFRGLPLMIVCHGRVMQVSHMEILGMTLREMEQYLNEDHPKNGEIRHYQFDIRTRKLVHKGVV